VDGKNGENNMKCVQCGKEILHGGLLISVDGDFVCDRKCKSDYEYEQANILDNYNDKKFIE